jgi:hypothetical protein
MRYTWAQFRTYLRLARQRRAQERILSFLSANQAQAGGQGAREFLQALQHDAKAAED